jgi:hypothetical protein
MDFLPNRAKRYVQGLARDVLLFGAAANFSAPIYVFLPWIIGIFCCFLILGLLILALYWGYQGLAAVISSIFWSLANVVELAVTALKAVFSGIIWIPITIVAAVIFTLNYSFLVIASAVNYIVAASMSTIHRILPNTAAAVASRSIVAVPASNVDNIFVATISSAVRFIGWILPNIIAIIYLLIVCCFWIFVLSVLFAAAKNVLGFLQWVYVGVGEKWEDVQKSPLKARFKGMNGEGQARRSPQRARFEGVYSEGHVF